MLLNLFHKNYFAQISWIIVFTILFAIPNFLQQEGETWGNGTLFLKLTCLHPWLKIHWVYQTLQFLLILGIAFLTKYFLTIHQLIHHSNFIPSLLIVALFSFQQLFDFEILISINLFLLVIYYVFILQSFDDDKPDNAIFSASLFIGLASLISYNNIIFIPLIWISFIVFQNYSWRYIPITIAGLIVPYLFFLTYLFWTDQLNIIIQEWERIQEYSYQLPQLNNLFSIIIFAILGFLVFISLAKIVPETSSKIIAIRKKVSFSLWFLFISIIVMLFSNDTIVKSIFLIPLSGLLGYYLRSVKNKRRIIDFIFSLFIIFLLFQKYYAIYAPILIN